MKKLFISLVVVAACMLGVGATSVQEAGATTCPYSGCVMTKTRITTPWHQHRGYVRFHVTVSPRSGSGSPWGYVRVTCSGPGRDPSKLVRYSGPRYVRLLFRRTGKWSCTAHFSSPRKWLPSSGSVRFHVAR